MKTKTLLPLLLYLSTGVTLADQMTAMRSGCMGCHQPDKATVGPSIKDIAAKHKAAGNVDELVAIVKKGKTPDELTWGTTPMPASPAAEGDVRTVVEWMLSQ
jgi:cytochrome c